MRLSASQAIPQASSTGATGLGIWPLPTTAAASTKSAKEARRGDAVDQQPDKDEREDGTNGAIDPYIYPVACHDHVDHVTTDYPADTEQDEANGIVTIEHVVFLPLLSSMTTIGLDMETPPDKFRRRPACLRRACRSVVDQCGSKVDH
jgi:hypothetical protein